MKRNSLLLLLLLTIKLANSVNLSGDYTSIHPNGTVRNFYGNNNITGNIVVKSKCILNLWCGIYKISPGVKITIEAGGQLCLYNAILTQSADNTNANSITLNTANNWVGIEILSAGGSSPSDWAQEELICPTPSCIGAPPDIQPNDGPLYKNGVMFCYKSKIRYSNYGVTVGGEIIDNSYWHFRYWWSGSGGGQLYAIKSSFENNRWRHLLFANYLPVNLSIVIGNRFITEQGVDPILDEQHRDIIIDRTAFKYNIEKNNFEVRSLFNNYWGIELRGAYARINNDTFKWQMAGVIYNTTAVNPTAPKWAFDLGYVQAVQNSYFKQCQVAIDNGAGTRVRVEKNIIQTCDFFRYNTNSRTTGSTVFTYFGSGPYPNYSGFTSGDNGTIGVYNGPGGYNLQCNGNSFITKPPILNPSKDASIVTAASGNLSSVFMNNTLSSAVSGFRSIANNKGFQIGCNTFKASRKNDILNDPSGLLSNQGTSSKPTGNVHSRFSGSGRSDILNLNTINYSFPISKRLKYYYKNGITPQIPLNFTSSTVTIAGTNAANNCNTSYLWNYESGCAYLSLLPPQKARYDSLKTTRNAYLEGGISPEEQEEFDNISQNYDMAMVNMMDYLILNGNAYNHDVSDSIKQLLLTHNTLNSKVYLVDWYISKDSFSKADNLMDSLLSNYSGDKFVEDFVEYRDLLSQCQQSDSTNAFLFSHFNNFAAIADSLGYFSHAALGIAQEIANLDSTNSFYHNQFYGTWVPDVSDTNLIDYSVTENIIAYPVPFSSSLTVSIENYTSNIRTFTAVLKDMDGTELFSHVVTVNANDLNTVTDTSLSTLVPGLYALQIYESSVLIDVRLINK